MKITFENSHYNNVDKVTTKQRSAGSGKTEKAGAYALDISGTVRDNITYGVQGRTAEEVMQEADNMNVDLLRDYMTVMSHSMSKEDFARMQKEGYSPTDTKIEDAVTIVDKIKAELAKAGVEVVGYTDTLDDDTLAKIAGSTGYAQAIKNALHGADVPVNSENVGASADAAKKASELTELTDGILQYMLEKGMQPTIENFYMAQHSGADNTGKKSGGYYWEEVPGYYTKGAEEIKSSELKEQIEKFILEAGAVNSEDTFQNASFLTESGLPITKENLELLNQIKNAKVPVVEKELFSAIASAIADGKKASQANLYDGRSYYEKAVDIDNEIDRLLSEAKEAGKVTERRQLEEVRLRMTVEVNVKLLKSGFSIDTSKLEELVDGLKELENQTAVTFFGENENAIQSYSLYNETLEKTTQLPKMPAAVVGRISTGGSATVNQVYDSGLALKKAYEQAGQSYEELMTAPRRDLGDDIQKAFRNVDEILQDMKLALTAENRRAVRILGYNNMEITQENLLAVKGADRTVQRVVEKMTPAATLQMIQDGVNPLETSLSDLEKYLDKQENFEDEAIKYSKYLYNLEKNSSISHEEKEAYIGVYRMLRQIEKTDGGAVGSLLKGQTDINFSNLLSAVRTKRTKGVDVSVDKDFGVTESINSKGVSISEQIAMGYTKGLVDAWTKEVEEQDYDSVLLKQAQQMSQVEEEVLSMLEKYEVPITIDTIMAASMLRQNRGDAMKRVWGEQIITPENEAMFADWEDILSTKEETVAEYKERIDEFMEATREHIFNEDMEALDVRELQLTHKQLTLMQVAASQEEFHIPALLGGQMTTIHLKIRHAQEHTGIVSVSMEVPSLKETGEAEMMTGQFKLDDNKVSGYVIGSSKIIEAKLKEVVTTFSESLKEMQWQVDDIPVMISTKTPELSNENESIKNVDTKDLYQLAKIFIKAFKHMED